VPNGENVNGPLTSASTLSFLFGCGTKLLEDDAILGSTNASVDKVASGANTNDVPIMDLVKYSSCSSPVGS
jgi:hypothetical protein